MTELHAKNLSGSMRERAEAFDRAKLAGDWEAARKLFWRLFQDTDTVIRESVRTRIEADALATELQLYRPHRADLTPAPMLAGYVYVTTAKQPWVCAAVEVRKVVYINAGAGYEQEHFTPEKKTVCGKPVNFPVSERFTSGGWPRLHELCPDCATRLGALGLIAGANQTPKTGDAV